MLTKGLAASYQCRVEYCDNVQLRIETSNSWLMSCYVTPRYLVRAKWETLPKCTDFRRTHYSAITATVAHLHLMRSMPGKIRVARIPALISTHNEVRTLADFLAVSLLVRFSSSEGRQLPAIPFPAQDRWRRCHSSRGVPVFLRYRKSRAFTSSSRNLPANASSRLTTT